VVAKVASAADKVAALAVARVADLAADRVVLAVVKAVLVGGRVALVVAKAALVEVRAALAVVKVVLAAKRDLAEMAEQESDPG